MYANRVTQLRSATASCQRSGTDQRASTTEIAIPPKLAAGTKWCRGC